MVRDRYVRLMVMVLVAGLFAGMSHVASADVITSIERRNSDKMAPVIVPAGLGELAGAFVDRDYVYINVPPSMIGSDYIMVVNDDRNNKNYELDVTVGEDAVVMLFVDNHLGNNNDDDPPAMANFVMEWVYTLGFISAEMSLEVEHNPLGGGGDEQYTIYWRKVDAGTTITLLEQYDGTNVNMYGVAAIAWDSINFPPVTDVAEVQVTVWPENSVQLDTTITDDGKPVSPGAVTVTWSVQSSPAGSTVEFDPDEFSENPVATFDKIGTYVLEITADDGDLYTIDYVTIAVREPDCPEGDLTADCRIDLLDLMVMCQQWMSDPVCHGSGCPDLNADDLVDTVDLARMAVDWTEKGSVLESTKLRLILSKDPYAFIVTEISTGEVILYQSETTFELGGSDYIAESAYNITTTETTMDADIVLAGTSETGHVTFSLENAETIQVLLSSNGAAPSNIKEQFVDQGEHYYGIWEQPQGGSIDNRGADRDLLGFTKDYPTFWANARAPFYVTSGKYGVYVDTVARGHYTVAKGGKTSFDFDEGQLKYYVIYGPSYGEIMNEFNQLAGPAWMPPDWAFDSIWWRNADKFDLGHMDLVRDEPIDSAQENVEATANNLQYYQIPASAIWIDRPYTSNNSGSSFGWGNIDFNTDSDRFPQPQEMINYVRGKGYEMMLWIANRLDSDLLADGRDRGYIFEGYTSQPGADVRRSEVYEWFKGELDYYVNMGIKGYKIDRGAEGTTPDSAENEVVYLFTKLTAEGQMAVHGNDYLIHGRNCFDKSRKYVGVWNGDSQSNFDGLSGSIKNGLRCGAINFPYYGSDTGGYTEPNQELFSRWFQFSTYCTMMEVLIEKRRTVWYDEDYPHDSDPNLTDIARKQCEDHHDLIPYTKSYMYQASQTGMPVMRQMIFEFPNDTSLYDTWDEYMYGPGILVAPVVIEGATSRDVYLPDGKWLDYNDKSTPYTGPTTIDASAPIDVIPLYVREGAIIPRGDILKANNNWTPDWAPYLRIEFFPYDNTAKTFDYYTGSAAEPIVCLMPDTSNVNISFGDLGYDGNLEIYCREYTAVTMNSTPLTLGVDFTYEPGENLMTIPFSGATTVAITGVQSIFNAMPDSVVPDVVDSAQSVAETAILDAALAIGTITEEHHSTVAAGDVISSDPIADTPVLHHSYVDLVVSLGYVVPIPDVANLPATNITGDSAQLNGHVSDNGFEDANVTVYWGTIDGGKIPDDWDNDYDIGPQNLTFFHDISSLSPSTPYFFRAYAENSTDGAWADSTESFTTASGVPIVFDATDNKDPDDEGGSSWTHTLGSGTNRILVVSVGSEGGNSFTGVTFGGVAMTLAPGTERGIDSDKNITAIFYMLEADLPSSGAAGTYDVVVSTENSSKTAGGSVSLKNVKQAGPEAVATAACGTGDGNIGGGYYELSQSITTSTDGAWIIDVIDCGDIATFVPDSPQVEIFDRVKGTSAAAGSTRAVPTAGTVTNRWVCDDSRRRSMSVAAFAPAP